MKLFGKKPESRQSDRKLLESILQNQVALGKKLDALDKRLAAFEKKQEKNFSSIISNLFIIYGKQVMARLNFLELSEGKPISISENEKREIENSMAETPDPKLLVLPLPAREQREQAAKKRKSRLN